MKTPESRSSKACSGETHEQRACNYYMKQSRLTLPSPAGRLGKVSTSCTSAQHIFTIRKQVSDRPKKNRQQLHEGTR